MKEYIEISIYSWPNVATFNMSTVEWMEIIEILIISQSSLVTLTRLIVVGLLLIYFIKISIKSTSQYPVAS